MGTIINHVPNMFYIEFRKDYVLLCQSCTERKREKSKGSPYCKALILAVMERWTNDKLSKGQELFVTMTHPQWVEAMYGRWVILDSLEELVMEKLLTREKYRYQGRESYKYQLNVGEVNRRLSALPRLLIDATNLQVDATGLEVDATGLEVDASPLKIDGALSLDASKSRPFLEEDTTKNHKDIRKKEDAHTHTPISDFVLTEEEERIRNWGRQLKVIFPKDQAKVKEYCSILVLKTQAFEEFESLYAVAERQVRGKEDKRVKLGNMANEDTLDLWEKERQFTATPLGYLSGGNTQPVGELPEEEPITEEYAWQPPAPIKPDQFIKTFMPSVCCSRGAREVVRQYQREVCQIYQDSTKEREKFERVLKQVDAETKGQDMPAFMTHLYQVMGIEMATPYLATQVVESTIMEAVI